MLLEDRVECGEREREEERGREKGGGVGMVGVSVGERVNKLYFMSGSLKVFYSDASLACGGLILHVHTDFTHTHTHARA